MGTNLAQTRGPTMDYRTPFPSNQRVNTEKRDMAKLVRIGLGQCYTLIMALMFLLFVSLCY
jgi:hypothetical protein